MNNEELYLDNLAYIGNILKEYGCESELEIMIAFYKEKKNEINNKNLPWKN